MIFFKNLTLKFKCVLSFFLLKKFNINNSEEINKYFLFNNYLLLSFTFWVHKKSWHKFGEKKSY